MNAFTTTTPQPTRPASALWSSLRLPAFVRFGARRKSAACDAAELMERAAAYEATQPGFAADLRAAAIRVTQAG